MVEKLPDLGIPCAFVGTMYVMSGLQVRAEYGKFKGWQHLVTTLDLLLLIGFTVLGFERSSSPSHTWILDLERGSNLGSLYALTICYQPNISSLKYGATVLPLQWTFLQRFNLCFLGLHGIVGIDAYGTQMHVRMTFKL
jgi:hypothetical protein